MAGIDSFTKLMLHFDNDVTDSEITPKSITNHGITFSTTAGQFKFNYGGVFNGSSYADCGSSSDWALSNSSFTIDFWVNPTGVATQQFIWMSGDGVADNYQFVSLLNQQIRFASRNSVAEVDYRTTNNVLTAGTMQHIAIVRDVNTWYMFLNGTSQALTLASGSASATFVDHGGNCYIGAREAQADLFLTGYLDELRFSKGIARWTSNFTPPTAPYTTTASAIMTTMRGIW